MTTRRFGSRYGKRVRDQLGKIEDLNKKPHLCPYCRKHKVKRLAVGIFECEKCEKKFTGKAYSLRKQKNVDYAAINAQKLKEENDKLAAENEDEEEITLDDKETVEEKEEEEIVEDSKEDEVVEEDVQDDEQAEDSKDDEVVEEDVQDDDSKKDEDVEEESEDKKDTKNEE